MELPQTGMTGLGGPAGGHDINATTAGPLPKGGGSAGTHPCGFPGRHRLAGGGGCMANLGRDRPRGVPVACLVSTWRPSTRRSYTSHLRRFAQFGGAVHPGDMQTLAEKVLLSMFAQGQKAAAARGCISALKAVATLGWIPPLQWDRLWRISKAAVYSPGQRQFGGPDLLQLMAESCSRVGEWKIYAAAVLSFATLCEEPQYATIVFCFVCKTPW